MIVSELIQLIFAGIIIAPFAYLLHIMIKISVTGTDKLMEMRNDVVDKYNIFPQDPETVVYFYEKIKRGLTREQAMKGEE